MGKRHSKKNTVFSQDHRGHARGADSRRDYHVNAAARAAGAQPSNAGMGVLHAAALQHNAQPRPSDDRALLLVCENGLFKPFTLYKNDHFTNTGSG
eukprot:COSAG06_NODE_4308_length_4374_cov_201.581520_4_plen_96_part_00